MTPGIWTGIYAHLPLHQALRALHGGGWRAFEISTEHLAAIEADAEPGRQVDLALACLRELGLEAPQAHAHLAADVAAPDAAAREEDIRRLERHTRLAAQLGARRVVMHPGGKSRFTTRAEEERIRTLNVEAFRRLGDAAGACGAQIGLENLMRPGAATPSELLGLLDAIGHPAIGLTLDTSHANVARLDPAKVALEFGPRLIATHISDNDGSGDQHRTPGSGTIDWRAVMRALRQAGYGGLLNLEIPGERHPVPALQELKLRHALDVVQWLAGPGAAG